MDRKLSARAAFRSSTTEADGTKLHADVLRPANLPADAKTTQDTASAS